jgi:hypothetical protein
MGFWIDPSTGIWKSEKKAKESKDAKKNKASAGINPQEFVKIVPFVEDCRNILIYNLPSSIANSQVSSTTLRAALSVGIVRAFQVESSEIVVEPLPKRSECQTLLIYEASEGGAGVLSQLILNQDRLRQVANEALLAMHYVKDEQGHWKDADDGSACVRACYHCLLSYFNQMDHEDIDRQDPDVFGLLTRIESGEITMGNDIITDPADDDISLEAVLNRAGLPKPSSTDIKIANVPVAAFYQEANLALIQGPERTLPAEFADYGISVCFISSPPTEEEIQAVAQYLH